MYPGVRERTDLEPLRRSVALTGKIARALKKFNGMFLFIFNEQKVGTFLQGRKK